MYLDPGRWVAAAGCVGDKEASSFHQSSSWAALQVCVCVCVCVCVRARMRARASVSVSSQLKVFSEHNRAGSTVCL